MSVFFFWRGPVKEKRTLFFRPTSPKRKCDLTSRGCARSDAALWPPGPHRGSAGPQLPRSSDQCSFRATYAPYTRRGARGAPLDASSDSTSRRSPAPNGYAWTAPRYSLITHAGVPRQKSTYIPRRRTRGAACSGCSGSRSRSSTRRAVRSFYVHRTRRVAP
jgi:hypothetical protein